MAEVLSKAETLGIPWLVYEAIAWLHSYLKPEMRVFEWGSGGSTLFLADRAHSVITIEHDPGWYSTVARRLLDSGIRNVSLVLCEPEKTKAPRMYHSAAKEYEGLGFQHYAESIDTYPGDTFDLVIVDGRARLACMTHALAKVRPGGYLMLDNSNRAIYECGKQIVSTWSSREFYGPGPHNEYPWATTIWQKPADLLGEGAQDK